MESLKKNSLIYIVLIALSFVLYGQTIGFDYALDDDIVILKNEFTKKGIGGLGDIFTTDSFHGFFGKQKNLVSGGRYRPLSIASFAFEWALFGENPAVSHFINVLLYGLTGLVIFLVLSQLFPPESNKYYSIAFLSSVLFLAHPLHTEVVANIKGRDEIMALLGALLSLHFFILYLQWNAQKWVIASGLSLFLACLSKENALTILPIHFLLIPLVNGWNKKALIGFTQFVVSFAAIYLILRSVIMAGGVDLSYCEILNNPFCFVENDAKFATIFYTWWKYLGLLVAPIKLTHDYYPNQIPIQSLTDWQSIFGLLLAVSLIAATVFAWKKQSKWIIPLLFFILPFSVVSNVFFNVGTFMNERFIYFSSLGFVIGLAALIIWVSKRVQQEKIILVLLVLISAAYSFKTMDRVPAWKDNATLFSTDVKVSNNSIKCLTSYGGSLIEKADNIQDEAQKRNVLQVAIDHLDKAIDLYPGNNHTQGWLLKGNANFKRGSFEKAFSSYRTCLEINPNFDLAKQNLKFLAKNALEARDPKQALYSYEYLLHLDKENANYYYKIGEIYAKHMGEIKQGIVYFMEAYKRDPSNPKLLENLGVANALLGNLSLAIKYLGEAIAVNPNHAPLHKNIAIAYDQSGLLDQARYHFAKADELSK